MEFRNLDSSSNEKGNKYKEILQKLTLLEEKGLWQQDVLTLKNMLNKDYEKGFMIETITSLSQFDTDNTKKTRIFSFNSAEKTKL